MTKYNFCFSCFPISYFIMSLSYSFSFQFIAKKKDANTFYRSCICYFNVLFSDLEKQCPDWIISLCFFYLNLSALSLLGFCWVEWNIGDLTALAQRWTLFLATARCVREHRAGELQKEEVRKKSQKVSSIL